MATRQQLRDCSFLTTDSLDSPTVAIAKAERQLNSTLSRDQAQGLEAVRRLKAEHNLTGVYAPIHELFTCTEPEMIAIEVTAKNQVQQSFPVTSISLFTNLLNVVVNQN